MTDDRNPGGSNDDLARPPADRPCPCRLCIDDRIAELERDLARIDGCSGAADVHVRRPLEIRLAELRRVRDDIGRPARLASAAPREAG